MPKNPLDFCGIPASAKHYAFAYPLAFPAEAGEQIDAVLDEISAAISDPRVPRCEGGFRA